MKKIKNTGGNDSTSFNFPIGRPIHWVRFDKESWYLRNTSNLNTKYIKRLEEIVDTSYDLLTNQIAGNAMQVNNEASFQLQFAYILKTLGELYKFSSDDLFTIELENTFTFKSPTRKSKTKTARIDIILTLGDFTNFATLAIELKFFKEINHREPNNRYDVFLDLHNLENYRKENVFDITYFILGTDHKHYVNKIDYSNNTSKFDFRDGAHYKAGTELIYGTQKPYGDPITLENDYQFEWDTIEKQFNGTGDKENLYFLKVKKSKYLCVTLNPIYQHRIPVLRKCGPLCAMLSGTLQI